MEKTKSSPARTAKRVLEKMTVPLVSVVLALLIAAIIIIAMGMDPIDAYYHLIRGSVGSVNALGETVINMIPLIILGLSYALARRCGLTNLGMEGQFYMGGLLACFVGINGAGLPSFIHIPLVLIAGSVGGMVWGAVAGALKVKFGANEVITTIMLNHIARNFANFMIVGPMCEPPGSVPQTARIAESAMLPRVIPGTRIHAGIIVALIMVVVVHVFLNKTKKGFETRVVGMNPEAARYAGMKYSRIAFLAMALAGGLAGLTGAVELMGVQFRLFQSFGAGMGFSGIPVAMLAQNSPFAILISSALFGILRSGSNAMQLSAGVPSALVGIIQGLVIVLILVSNLYGIIKTRLALRKRAALGGGTST